MWRRVFQSWLVGAAVTITIADCGQPPDSAALGRDDAMASSEQAGPERPLRDRRCWTAGEPRLAAVMTDPIVRLMMRSDGVSVADLSQLITEAQSALASRATGQAGTG